MKKFFCVAAVCAAAVFCCGCGEKRPVKMQSVDTAMGTVIQQNIYTTDELSNGTKEILDKRDSSACKYISCCFPPV